MGVEVFEHTAPGAYRAPFSAATGDGAVRGTCFTPGGGDAFAVTATLEAGAAIEWPAAHGDEAVRVLDGRLAVDGHEIGPGDAIVVESGGAATLRALTPARILQFGSRSADAPTDGALGPPADGTRGVHVARAGAGPTFRSVVNEGTTTDFDYYADSTCPTCRLTLLRVGADGAYTGGSHFHTQDELIHVTDGEIRVGPNAVQAGSTVFIPASFRYSFRTTGAFEFVNYRRDVSFLQLKPEEPARIETVAATEELWARMGT